MMRSAITTTITTKTTIMRSSITTTKTSNWLYYRQAANTKINKKNDIKTSTNQPDLLPAGGEHELQAVEGAVLMLEVAPELWLQRVFLNECQLHVSMINYLSLSNFCNAFVLITIIFFIIMLMAKKCLIFYGLCTISPPGPCYQSRRW